ncbi:MAG: patatin-like phospholipase RssA [Acidiferrobacterales bacterium]
MKIGLALGGGSARGWSHIGVIRELTKLGIEPGIVCGTSIGALVGGAYCSGNLDGLEEWVCGLNRLDVARYLDVSPLRSGGAIKGEKLFSYLRGQVGDPDIETFEKPFAAVATKLASGQEVWLRKGSLLQAVRASISFPGLFDPVRIGEDWVVDGGLVNPVPVSVCFAMGADIVIAVNLNGGLRGGHESVTEDQPVRNLDEEPSAIERFKTGLKEHANTLLTGLFDSADKSPGLVDVLSASIHIMQDRITRSRLAGDFPDVIIAPRLSRIGLMEFHRAEEAIKEGHASVRRALPLFEDLLL